MRGDVELLCQNRPVAGGLVEHINVVAVFKDVLHLAGGKQVFDILRDTCRDAAPLSKTLPNLDGVGRSLFLMQQQVHLVDVETGGLASGAVFGDSVPYRVLHNQHPDFFELFAQLADVKADHAGVNVDVGAVIEHIERTGDIDFKRGGDVLRLLFVLPPQLVIQVLQHRHILRRGIVEIVPIDQPHTAVNDGFLHRLQAVLAAYDQLAERKDEVGFQRQRVFIVRVVEV